MDDKIVLNIVNGNLMVANVNDIISFEKDGRYIKVIFKHASSCFINMTMRDLTLFLEEQELNIIFLKPHFSYYININHVKLIRSTSIIMSNKSIIPISNNYKSEFKNEIKERILELKL